MSNVACDVSDEELKLRIIQFLANADFSDDVEEFIDAAKQSFDFIKNYVPKDKSCCND